MEYHEDMEKAIAVIDLKAFYAFVECVERKLDPFTTPLVVCDAGRGTNTIVLSVTPYLKAQGVSSRCRKKELPHRDDLIYAVPRMDLYIRRSAEVIAVILSFIGEDDVHVYSIDEAFVNLGPYLRMYQMTARQLVLMIQKKILEETGLVVAAGIAPNMFLAKVALDLDAKSHPPYITVWKKSDIRKKLWPVTPLSRLWGISTRYEKRLNALGIFTVGELAAAPKEFLKEKFGVIGEQLHEHANGIDDTDIREKYEPVAVSFSNGQVLAHSQPPSKTRLIIREMNDDLARRLREKGAQAGLVMLGIVYDEPDEKSSFSRQQALSFPTDDTEKLLTALLSIHDAYGKKGQARKIRLAYGNIVHEEYEQLSLFEDQDAAVKRRRLTAIVDELKRRYGQNVILRGSALLEESTAKKRHEEIGGHRK